MTWHKLPASTNEEMTSVNVFVLPIEDICQLNIACLDKENIATSKVMVHDLEQLRACQSSSFKNK